MVFNINEECFKSNEFLEWIKNRKQTSKSNQNLICLEPEIKIQNQDTLSILIDSTTRVTQKSNTTNEKISDIDNKIDNNFFTEKSILDITNKVEFYKSEENDIQLEVSKNQNKKINENTTDKPSEDIIEEEKKNFSILNYEEDIICNQNRNSDHTTDGLHKVNVFENEFWGNIYLITRENTIYNKKIPHVQKHMEKGRKNDSINDFKDTQRNRRVTFDEKSNSYIFIDETEIVDKSSAKVFAYNNKNFSLQIYTQPIIQIIDLGRYLYEKKTFINFEKKTYTDIQVSNMDLLDMVRNKNQHSTIKEYEINTIDILNTTKVTAMKDICVIESFKDYCNHIFTEINKHNEYSINLRKKEYLALPYYRDNEESNMGIENKIVISYCKTNKNDAKSDKITENSALQNKICCRQRDKGYLAEMLKNMSSAFDLITRTVIKLCYCT